MKAGKMTSGEGGEGMNACIIGKSIQINNLENVIFKSKPLTHGARLDNTGIALTILSFILRSSIELLDSSISRCQMHVYLLLACISSFRILVSIICDRIVDVYRQFSNSLSSSNCGVISLVVCIDG
jgi:hypothetical protein